MRLWRTLRSRLGSKRLGSVLVALNHEKVHHELVQVLLIELHVGKAPLPFLGADNFLVARYRGSLGFFGVKSAANAERPHHGGHSNQTTSEVSLQPKLPSATMSARLQALEKAEADKARQWLEDTLGAESDHTHTLLVIVNIRSGLEVGEDFFVALGDGVLLCSIINTIKPGTINKVRHCIPQSCSPCLINEQVNPAGRAKKLPPKRMENINNFIFGARKLGMLKSQLFEVHTVCFAS